VVPIIAMVTNRNQGNFKNRPRESADFLDVERFPAITFKSKRSTARTSV